MRLIDDWRAVLRRAWSIRLALLAALLSGLEVLLPFLDGVIAIPHGVFAALAGLTSAAAFYARLVAQKGLSNADQ